MGAGLCRQQRCMWQPTGTKYLLILNILQIQKFLYSKASGRILLHAWRRSTDIFFYYTGQNAGF